MTIADALRRSPELADLEPSSLDALAFAFQEVWYPRGTDLIRAGDPVGPLHLVLEGEVAIIAGERELSRAPAGELLGLLSLIDGEPRSVTCRAATTVRAAVLSRDAYTRLVNVNAKLGHAFHRALGRQLAADFRRLTAPKRTGRSRPAYQRAFMAWG